MRKCIVCCPFFSDQQLTTSKSVFERVFHYLSYLAEVIFGNFEALIGCRNPALSVPIGSQHEPLDADNSERHYGVLGDKLQSLLSN